METTDVRALLPDGYSVARRNVPVGGIDVHMFVVADPNRLAMNVAAEDFATDERLPYWAELWPAAQALGEFIVRRGRLDGVDVLELGCGMGLTGVVAAILGGDVLFTDFEPDALAFASANHALNIGVPGATQHVDWRNPPVGLAAPLVLGADVVYEQRFIDPFIATLSQVVAPGGAALVAEPDRRVAAGAIERLEGTGFRHELHLEEVTAVKGTVPVWIHELIRPA